MHVFKNLTPVPSAKLVEAILARPVVAGAVLA